MIKLVFNIDEQTVFGEDVVLNLEGKKYRMATADGRQWSIAVAAEYDDVGDALSYYYHVEQDGVVTRQSGSLRLT